MKYNVPTGMRYCRQCDRVKSLEEFVVSRRNLLGRGYRCYECHRKANKQSIERHRETRNERNRAWSRENLDYYREYARSRPEMRRTVQRNWRQNNPEQVRAGVERYRARKINAEGAYTVEEWQNLCESYQYRCLCCGQQKPLTVDHVVPLSQGGTNYIDNIQPLCETCNKSKGNKIIDYRPR